MTERTPVGDPPPTKLNFVCGCHGLLRPLPRTCNVGYTATGRLKLRRYPSASPGQLCLMGEGARAPREYEVKFRGGLAGCIRLEPTKSNGASCGTN
eukprot:3515505-Lingulodinium_polyedra.AAC.1